MTGAHEKTRSRAASCGAIRDRGSVRALTTTHQGPEVNRGPKGSSVLLLPTVNQPGEGVNLSKKKTYRERWEAAQKATRKKPSSRFITAKTGYGGKPYVARPSMLGADRLPKKTGAD